jgi:mono/diheme cytochrome c family protein
LSFQELFVPLSGVRLLALLAVCVFAGGRSAAHEAVRQPLQSPVLSPAAASAAPMTGTQMYEMWCVVCHAPDGTGRSPTRPVRTPPLNFADCGQASAESDVDWRFVIVKGGPAVGRSSEMPSFEVLSEAQV